MFRSRLLSLLFAVATATACFAQSNPQSNQSKFNLGRAATPEEVKAWDIDVRPDGQGLPKGRGSVAAGQVVYEKHCESCHGTFGENNEWMAIAGGVRKIDLEKGRASALTEDATRTVGTKLNHATTLWDYINRAMPMMTPKTLTADEVYAVTAYVLHLNDILPAEATLDETSLAKVKMPNRNGFTREHGKGTARGKGDVQGSTCTQNCASEIKVTSSLPEYARNAHGNLAEQGRALGPYRMVDTSGVSTERAKALPANAAPAAAALVSVEKLAADNTCSACHAAATKLVGPSWSDIAKKYKGQANAEAELAKRVKNGSSGVWGAVPMPPNAAIKDADLSRILKWVLQQ